MTKSTDPHNPLSETLNATQRTLGRRNLPMGTSGPRKFVETPTDKLILLFLRQPAIREQPIGCLSSPLLTQKQHRLLQITGYIRTSTAINNHTILDKCNDGVAQRLATCLPPDIYPFFRFSQWAAVAKTRRPVIRANPIIIRMEDGVADAFHLWEIETDDTIRSFWGGRIVIYRFVVGSALNIEMPSRMAKAKGFTRRIFLFNRPGLLRLGVCLESGDTSIRFAKTARNPARVIGIRPFLFPETSSHYHFRARAPANSGCHHRIISVEAFVAKLASAMTVELPPYLLIWGITRHVCYCAVPFSFRQA